MEVTIGGNRLGSGEKMKGRINNYHRSTHNLSEKWASSMAPGVLYPAMCKLATRGDSFDISINADARTIPTKGPLFGSYKMQVDVFQIPVRLYQGILHNNPLAIGLKMNQVKFPILSLTNDVQETEEHVYDFKAGAVNNTSLLKYLGLSGLGSHLTNESDEYVKRDINAIPLIAYYDIFKTYYANKQEEKGYVIGTNYNANTKNIAIGFVTNVTNGIQTIDWPVGVSTGLNRIQIIIPKKTKEECIKFLDTLIDDDTDAINIYSDQGTNYAVTWGTIENSDYMTVNINPDYGDNTSAISITGNFNEYAKNEFPAGEYLTKIEVYSIIETIGYSEEIGLNEFNLQNIDDMRYELLGAHELGYAYTIGYDADWQDDSGTDKTGLPYSANFKVTEHGVAYQQNMAGLCLKTYQNDIYNNWLNTDWLEGENGINELSKVSVNDGSFSMDALNFATKLYNMLNRIAVAGATYEDWQDVVYEEVKRKQIESPIFCGGLSQEIYFDEIVQSAPTEGQPLGTLGGRGRLSGKKKGGKLHIKCDEACFIMAIVSLTPRIYYTQGNEFYLTDIFTMDDLHKPAMDGIGFQDLVGERLAWWDAHIGTGGNATRHKIGKLPAWVEYMTSVDKAYGDFAGEYGTGFMILNRNYERDESTGLIKDATTYVDPSKYNYAFADASLTAQNFWVQINFDIKARRLMSARIIPNV